MGTPHLSLSTAQWDKQDGFLFINGQLYPGHLNILRKPISLEFPQVPSWLPLLLIALYSPEGFCCSWEREITWLRIRPAHIPAQNTEYNEHPRQGLGWGFQDQIPKMLSIPTSLIVFLCLLHWNWPYMETELTLDDLSSFGLSNASPPSPHLCSQSKQSGRKQKTETRGRGSTFPCSTPSP